MIKDSINADLKTAMLGGDKELTNVLRVAKSVILDSEVNQGKREEGLSDNEVESLLQKEVKKRSEASEMYEKAGEKERADKEMYEVGVIQKYLPKALSEDELSIIVDEVISSLGDDANMGQIIGQVKAKTGASADGSMIANLVKGRLSSGDNK